MIRPIKPKTETPELFCQKYWQKMKKRAILHYQEPELFDYNIYNHILLNINKPKENDKKVLGKLDLSFRLFEPCKEKCTNWRGVTDPSHYYEDLPDLKNYFNKCKNIQPGEILYMKEFPYTSSSSDYAKVFISNSAKDCVNILFEIEIPEGTCFFNNGYRNVLQRCSRFLCTETQLVQDGEKTYQHIKLTLLPRDIEQNSELKETFLQRIISKLISIF